MTEEQERMVRAVLRNQEVIMNALADLLTGDPSALTHSEGSAWQLTLARMALAVLVHMKGRGLSLCSAM